MSPRRLTVALLVAIAALVAALPAAGKEGVKATLTTAVPLDAKPGTRLRIGWSLAYLDEHGQRRPFGAGGVFVRLLSASGAAAETGFARGSGDYAATVAVPKGGIGHVEIGIRGWSTGPSGTHPAPVLFPITNDPLASERAGSGSRTWIFAVVAGSLLAVCALAAAGLIARRRRTERPRAPRRSAVSRRG